MRLYLITLHRAKNYGSVLQAFALQEKLKEKNCEVTLLDFLPHRYTNRGLLRKLRHKSSKFKNPLFLLAARILILPSYFRKNRVFSIFVDRYLKVSNVKFASSEDAKGKFDDADIYCTGSDQVWNSYWNDGIDKALYLDFAPKGRLCFSYAASIGLETLPKEEIEATKKLLDKYEFISLRENSGVEIVKQMGRDCIQVLDPTLLYGKEKWNLYASDKYKKEKFVLTYNLHHDPEIDRYAQALAKEKHLKVLNISYNWHDVIRKGKLMWCPSVEEFLGLIRDAQYVIADSFHALAFSVIFEKQFVSICPEIASSRITSLLGLLGLESRLEYKFTDTSNIQSEINYSSVRSKLEVERKKSEGFIDMVLYCKSFTHNI